MNLLERYLLPPGDIEIFRKEFTHGRCLYYSFCGNELNKSNEHIFNSSWGGIITADDIICAACNNGFSSTLDTSFDDYAKRIINARGMITERKKRTPAINLEGNAKLAPYAQLVPRNRTIAPDITKPAHEIIDTPITMQYRSTIHTCLCALAYFQPELVRNAIFDSSKHFAYTGENNLRNFARDATVLEADRLQFYMMEFNHVVILSEEWLAEEMIITINETYGLGIRARLRSFVVDRGLPKFIEIHDTHIDGEFVRKEIETFGKWRRALAPTYKFQKFMKNLESNELLLSWDDLKNIKGEFIAMLMNTLPYYSDREIQTLEVLDSIQSFGIAQLLEEYSEKKLDDKFWKIMKEIWSQTASKIVPTIKFLN
jgi:hypothetical protein